MGKKDKRYPDPWPIMDKIRALPIEVALKAAPEGSFPGGWGVRITFPLNGRGASLVNHDGSWGIELLADDWENPATCLEAEEVVAMIREMAALAPITQPEQQQEPLADWERQLLAGVDPTKVTLPGDEPTLPRGTWNGYLVLEYDQSDHGRIVGRHSVFLDRKRAERYMETLREASLTEARVQAAWRNEEYDPEQEWLYASFDVVEVCINNL